jgi:tetratricopeptide (TPR) repeat protein
LATFWSSRTSSTRRSSSYKDGLAIRQALAAKDPSNTQWQSELSVSDDNIGDVLVTQDKLDEALASYKRGLAIRQALAAKDPSNTQWQRDLAWSDAHIGEVLFRQRKLDGAVQARVKRKRPKKN